MALRAPTTPTTPRFTSAPSTPITPTGTWRHPEIDKVTKRIAENTFTDASFMVVTYNMAAFVASFVAPKFLLTNESATSLASIFPAIVLTYGAYAFWGLRLLFLWNTYAMLKKLLKPADEFTDISMTPGQRKLLGLNPDTPLSAAAASPEKFATPPRYSKTPTSRNATPIPTNTSPTLTRKAAPGNSGFGNSSLGNSALGNSALGNSTFGNSSLGMSGISSFSMDSPSPKPMGSPLRMGGRPVWGSPRNASPKTVGNSSVTPSNLWAYEKNALNRKSNEIRLSPSKPALF